MSRIRPGRLPRQNLFLSVPMGPEAKLLLRVEKAAGLLGLSRTRVFKLIADGELGSVKVGGSRRVPRDALTAYVRRLQSDAPAGRAGRSRA